MRTAIVGPGRLGRSLETLLRGAGWVVTIHGRGEVHDEGLELVILTVPDEAIVPASLAVVRGPTVLHCSGATSWEVLRPHQPAGSIHPLMTFPGPEVGIPPLDDVPAAIDGDEAGIRIAEQVARALGMRPVHVTGDRRLYHAAAVMAGNYATLLLAEAARILSHAGVPEGEAAGLLAPLAAQSILGAVPNPGAAITGPAARGDRKTLERHRAALRENGLLDVVPLYDLLGQRTERLSTLTREP